MPKKVSALENQIAGYIESQAYQDAATLQRLSDSHWQPDCRNSALADFTGAPGPR